ncbi:hypothetical protein HanXRQr2_Chr08g0322431 [Helianthus annuus]|uniref:Uncharacterized protein n=1 Tax=Helianthus annuus TaxID=4232 RepID=A0A9K3IBP2_HELAN|nr:hypothetical protein HanXRQr2_Chr08g0322431 [Helianthus annuus]KAJ0537655.1 hypothetical protein HanHA300_Chr08g0266291 [Helianthus annuus]KAJ0552238.1 hypothetical protein HanHA89_Chr08g0283091 [Helianthus annuus]
MLSIVALNGNLTVVGSRVPAAVPVTLIGRFWRWNGRVEGDLEQPQPQRLESCFRDNFGSQSKLFILNKG